MLTVFILIALLLVVAGLILLSMFKTAILATICVTLALLVWIFENDYPRGGYHD